MKTLSISIVLFFWINILLAQKVNLESSVFIDTSKHQINTQRVEISGDFFNLKYDYKEVGHDVFSLTLPKLFSDSLYNFGAVLIKMGDGLKSDRYALDFFAKFKFGKLSTSFELARIFSQSSEPNDVFGLRLSGALFTAEACVVASHSFGEMINKNDQFYAWLAYHPKNFFVSTGIAGKQYWLLGGTKNLNNFGNFLLANYNPENGNFWFRNQSALGQIDQGFFNQDLYLFATSYLVVPAFHFQHFSPIATKGTYSLKIDGRRTNGVHNYELAMGREVGRNLFRMAVGINSEYEEDFRFAPVIEFYKDFKLEHTRPIIELRYDFLYKSLSAYLVFRY